jgi:lysozyme family protein
MMRFWTMLKNLFKRKRNVEPIDVSQNYSDKTVAQKLEELYESLIIRPIKRQKASDVNWYVNKINENKQEYINACNFIKEKRGYSLDWRILAVIHILECGGKMDRQILNGEKWSRRTSLVPKGYGPWDSFEESCLTGMDIKKKPENWTIGETLDFLEKWNGLGYRRKGKNSPYLWSYSNHQEIGKYVSDGVYDPDAVSLQVGCAVLLKKLDFK